MKDVKRYMPGLDVATQYSHVRRPTMNETAQGNYVLYSDLEAAHKTIEALLACGDQDKEVIDELEADITARDKRIAELEAFREAVRREKKKFSQQAKDARDAGDITWAARLLGCEIRLSALLEQTK